MSGCVSGCVGGCVSGCVGGGVWVGVWFWPSKTIEPKLNTSYPFNTKKFQSQR